MAWGMDTRSSGFSQSTSTMSSIKFSDLEKMLRWVNKGSTVAEITIAAPSDRGISWFGNHKCF